MSTRNRTSLGNRRRATGGKQLSDTWLFRERPSLYERWTGKKDSPSIYDKWMEKRKNKKSD